MGLYEGKIGMRLFFDLDGTLIDAKPRLYNLFQQLVPESSFSFNDYWILKQSKMSHQEILITRFGYSEAQFILFEKEWMKLIESDEFLKMDKPFDITNYLNGLKRKNELYVITARQFEEKAIMQLKSFGWEDMFEKVFVTKGKTEKYDLLKNSINVTTFDWLIGDTGKDILTGKRLGMYTAGVLSGFLSREKLQEYNPDVLVNSITDLQFD